MVTITSIHIDAFGKLSNVDQSFDSSYNAIVGNNSTGKTTMLYFIRAMFYGLDRKVKYNIDKDNNIYKPWNNSAFGGSMDFVWDNVSYRITRKFGATAKTDICQLLRLDSMKTVQIDNLGEAIFGFGAETFDRSIFVHQEQISITGDSGEMSSKLSTMTDGQGNHSLAVDKLDKYRKELYTTHKNGILPTLQQQRDSVEQKLRYDQALLDNVRTHTSLIQHKQTQLEQYHAQILQLDDSKAKLTAQVQLAQYQQTDNSQLNDAQQTLARQDWQDVDADYSALLQLYNKPTTKASWNMTLLLLTCILSVVCGVLLGVLIEWYYGIIPLLIGAVVLVLARPRRDNSTSIEISRILHKYLSVEQCTDGNKALSLVFDIKDKVNSARATVAGSSSKPTVDHAVVAQLQQVEADLAQLQTSKHQCTTDIAKLTAQKDHAYATTNVVALQEQLLQLDQQIDTAKYRLALTRCSLDVIACAKEKMSMAYLPTLQQRTGQMLSYITSGLFDSVHISDKFDVQLSEGGIMREIKYYSCGTKELVLFCYRVVLSQMLCDNSLPLLLVDDAFVNLDDGKYAQAMKLLQQISQDTQVVYVSCHNRATKA